MYINTCRLSSTNHETSATLQYLASQFHRCHYYLVVVTGRFTGVARTSVCFSGRPTGS